RVETEPDYLARLDQGWEIILADYVLPGFDGLRALALLRERGFDIPFIIVSGTIGEEKAVQAMKDGATDYVIKDRLARLGQAVERGLHEVALRRERQRWEETLRKREGDLQLAQRIGHIGSWESDPAAGTLVWSEEVYRIFGCDPAAFVPTREAFIQLVHAEDRARVRDAVAESIRNGADYELEHRIRRSDGTERVVHEKGCFLRDASGKAGRLVGTVQDITERKKLEMQFLRAQRMEAVGALAGGIAHDLNNILAPILMGAPMLRQPQTPSEIASTLDAIESSAQRGAAVVRQLLTFSRGQSGQRISLHLNHLLRDLRNITRETFPKDIHFVSSEAPDLWPLVADPTQLHQVLLNLCINARDAMPEGGTLAVTAANFQADDSFVSMAPGARPGVYVLLQVSDTGAGIRPEHLDKIFDPFFTTKEVGRGTGLGLAVVQRVVTGHGGVVRVRSQVGQGTTFAVYLPASPEAAAPATPASPSALLDGQGQLILVVDDEEPVRLVTQQTLVHHGYAVVTASDGAEAVAVFARHRHQIKAALVDLVMPGMNGLELVKVLVRMAPALPVLVSTGAGSDPAQSEKLAALRRLGVHVFLDKPYTTNELLQTLHAVLSREGKHE
ncbi:MAG: response regulator, partial [Verrucomicrobia bacterium]|nr:response regulator [Verrucomicrobiota bacterium]